MNQPGRDDMKAAGNTGPASRTFTWTSRDGLTLSGREWRPDVEEQRRHPTILCLTGLSRNTRDFNDIATFLQMKGYHVVALDYRGRGESAWDPEWHNYAIPVEGHDIDDAIEVLGLNRFAILGTSRGGLHAMAMAHRYGPDRMVGAILNDVGPHLEMKAIHRIAASLGKKMQYPSFEALAEQMEHMLGPQFSSFSKQDWFKLSHQLASSRGDGCVIDYDPALAHTLIGQDDASPVPDIWHLYEALENIPLLIIHGELSDLLSRETCDKMLATHPDAKLVTVRGQGHAPVLWDDETQQEIVSFLGRLSA
ncbi:alpha/beta hydrolase [uncultured Roseibium sp.]|uniref:alpha/beta fold hydrolase n=1 Tax=uncultured Roseibium sp. TaxID=1936171 RepID=UPI003217DF5E